MLLSLLMTAAILLDPSPTTKERMMTTTPPPEGTPEPPTCDGSVFCPVPGHVQSWMPSATTRRYTHRPLSRGERMSLRGNVEEKKP